MQWMRQIALAPQHSGWNIHVFIGNLRNASYKPFR
jgi:hypothetical protein